MFNIIRKISNYYYKIEKDRLKTMSLLGNIESKMLNYQEIKNIQDAEFSVFSQWGEDGIIQLLINKIPIANKVFIEFGVGNYKESNTLFLLLNNNWKGLIIDCKKDHIKFLQRTSIMWKYNITPLKAFITKDNINDLIKNKNILGDIGLLPIDIDGNDYWIFEAIEIISPRILIIEYNNTFGIKHPITVPYKENFNRTNEHYSNLFYGASLKALTILAKNKGYDLIGSNSAGNNAFFLREDLVKDFKPLNVEDVYVKNQFRESRDKSGNLTYIHDSELKLELIEDMNVFNVEKKEITKIKDLDMTN